PRACRSGGWAVPRNLPKSPRSCSAMRQATSPGRTGRSTAGCSRASRSEMALKYYHAEPLANSLKSMIPLKEKGLAYESVYVDLHKFEQHSDWFVAINPEGQVPVLDHDGTIVTHTTVINEYLEDVFPEDQPDSGPLRPRDPVGAARMRYWNKFVDEHVMNHVSMHGWHRLVGVIARNIDEGTFEELLSHIPLPDQRKKWATARSGFSEA